MEAATKRETISDTVPTAKFLQGVLYPSSRGICLIPQEEVTWLSLQLFHDYLPTDSVRPLAGLGA